MGKGDTKMAEEKKTLTKEQQEEFNLRAVVGSIMTKNVEMTFEEYNAMLEKIGMPKVEIEKTNSQERLARIQSNFYGTIVNMNFSLLRQVDALTQEVECWRALLRAMCEKMGIDASNIKTANDITQEAIAKFFNAKNKKKK